MIIYSTHIHALGNRKYKLRCPLLITIERCEDEVLAIIPEFDLYASGVSDSMALSYLKTEIVSTYERLVELGPDKLGGFMLQCLEAMQAVIVATKEETE